MTTIYPAKVESIVEVHPRFLNMTPAEEEKLYGSLSEYVTQQIDFYRAQCILLYQLTFTSHTIDLVWDGWDAAFIKSKGEEAWPVATLESTGLAALAGSQLRKVLGKRKSDEFSPSDKAADEGVEKDYLYNFLLPIGIKTKEEAVTLFAYHVLGPYPYWDTLEQLFGPDCCAVIRKRVLDLTVKFVLSTFDEEDYFRIYHWNEVKVEYMRFCVSHAGETSNLATLSGHKFSYLTEADVYEACVQISAHKIQMSEDEDEDDFSLYCNAMQFMKDPAIDLEFSMSYYKESDVADALELMQKHRPLKGYLRAQHMLELSRLKCYHINDTLTLEAFKDFNLPEFYGKCESESADQCRDLLSLLGDVVLDRLGYLIIVKTDEIRNAEKSLMKGMQCSFGPFKDEVYEVVKRANHERRMANKRFTGLAHIWSALSFSRVRDCLPEIVNQHLCPQSCLLDDSSSSKIYTFRLYELSRELASHLGHKEIGLEHLVFSILYGSSKKTLMQSYYEEEKCLLFERLQNSQADSEVESWRNIDVYTTLLGRRCRFGSVTFFDSNELVNNLQKAAEEGKLVLPRYEDLRAM